MGKGQSLSLDLAIQVHEELRRRMAVAVTLPNEKFLNCLTEAEGKTFWTPAVLFASPQQTNLSYRPHLAKFIVKLCSLDQPNQSFKAYAGSIEEMTFAAKGAVLASWKTTME